MHELKCQIGVIAFYDRLNVLTYVNEIANTFWGISLYFPRLKLNIYKIRKLDVKNEKTLS